MASPRWLREKGTGAAAPGTFPLWRSVWLEIEGQGGMEWPIPTFVSLHNAVARPSPASGWH